MTEPSSKTSSHRGLTDKPVEIPYKRWKHKDKGYIVTVYGVRNYLGKHGYLSVVDFREKDGPERTMPATGFLKAFSPIGRKLKIKSWMERI